MVFSTKRKTWRETARVEDYREWETLHRDIIRCLARHVDPCQFPELRLLNKHWCTSCDAITTKLSISNQAVNHFGSPSIPVDMITKRFTSLQSLVLWKLNPTDTIMLSRLEELTLLDLGGTFIDDESLRHISRLTKLTTLQLWETDVGDTGIQFLSVLRQLSTLSLRDSKLGDDGMQSVACLTNMTALDLDRTLLTDEGAKCLVPLKKLQRLSLWNTTVGDGGASCLSHLTDLTRLNIGLTKITEDGLVHLAELTKLISLELWGIRRTVKQTPDEEEQLEDA